MMPPASRIGVAPSDGLGTPAEMCTRPAAEKARAVRPMPMRLVEEASSGARSRRSPSRIRTIGTARPTRPKVPATTAWTTSPTGPRSAHHSRAATMMARAMRAKPIPSRRCSGSSSRALWPTLRTVPPARWATPIHAPRTARTGQGRGAALRGAGLRAAGLRAAGLRLAALVVRAAGRAAPPRPEELEREEEVVRVATFAGYAIVPTTSRVTRASGPARRAAMVHRRAPSRPPARRSGLTSRDITPEGWAASGRRRYRRAQVMSASVKPRLAGRQPSSRGGVLRVTTRSARARGAGKRGPASPEGLDGPPDHRGVSFVVDRHHQPDPPPGARPRPAGPPAARPRAPARRPGAAAAHRGRRPRRAHAAPDGRGLRQLRPRGEHPGTGVRPGCGRHRAAHLLLGAPGQRLRLEGDQRVVRAGPRAGGLLRRGARGGPGRLHPQHHRLAQPP